jgi:AcrR family transcriptional regulator
VSSADNGRHVRILKAAAATFARHGYRRTSMEAIAAAADMSRPALYQYFANKEAVFREMTRWLLDRNAVAAEAAAQTAANPVEALLDAVLALHAPSAGAHFFELIDEVQQRAGDLWAQHEKRFLDAIRGHLPGREDVAAVLFYGAKGISLAPYDVEQRRAYLRQLVALAT